MMVLMQALLVQLQTGAFLTPTRARLWAGASVVGLLLALAFLVVTAHGASDYAGRPLGTDFSNVYAAGRAALAGDAAAPFDIVRQAGMERTIFGPHTPIYGWHYPPSFLLLAAPLAAMPYGAALALWLTATLALYLLAMQRLLAASPSPDLAQGGGWFVVALGFPAVMVNALHGQNGFLTAALMALGLALLDRRPILAGIALGLLSYKPQYGAVIPLALMASGHWRTFAAAAIAAVTAALAATWLFGWPVWPAFLDGMHFTRTVVLEQGDTGFAKMQSVFAAVRLLGGSIGVAYGVQGVIAIGALVLTWHAWRSGASRAVKGVMLCLAALLVTPYSMDYDLMLLAPAIALYVAEGRARGFLPWEASLLALCWALPALARPMAQYLSLPLGVPVLLAAMYLLSRRLPHGQMRWQIRSMVNKGRKLTTTTVP